MRHIAEKAVASTIASGGSIEQLLAGRVDAGRCVVRFLGIERKPNHEISVTCFEVIDEGTVGAVDVYEFPSLDPDSAYGDSVSFESVDAALAHAEAAFGAAPDRYVHSGVIQDEYRDARA